MKKKVSKLKQSKSKKISQPKIKQIKEKPIKVVKQKTTPIIVKPAKDKKDHYVDSNVFRQLIIQSYKTNIISEELASCIMKIANKLSYHPRFINYTYKEEMVGDAIEKMLKAVKNKKYDPELGNAFAYFTRITYNAFFNKINKERKEKEFILNLQDNTYTDMENSGFDGMNDDYAEENYYE